MKLNADVRNYLGQTTMQAVLIAPIVCVVQYFHEMK